ncbi:MAG: hypothetical protein VX259_11140 [Pseudomonadota bacterium]|nr:hypothetical protein [Pseudomonadota bacterium]
MPFLQQVSRSHARLSLRGWLSVSVALLGGMALMAFWSPISLSLGTLSLILGSMALWPRSSAAHTEADLDREARVAETAHAKTAFSLTHLALAAVGVLVALQLLA